MSDSVNTNSVGQTKSTGPSVSILPIYQTESNGTVRGFSMRFGSHMWKLKVSRKSLEGLELPITCVAAFLILLSAIGTIDSLADSTRLPLHRAKRFIWMTKERKLILPPGSSLIVTPKLQIPFIRQPPEGINSDIQISWPFYLFFDGLGMTHIDHPWPPPLFYPFTPLFYDSSFLTKTDKKNSRNDKPKKWRSSRSRAFSASILSLPPPDKLPGGERAILLPKLESILSSFGIQGRSCLQRIICEVHEYPLGEGYGLFGEFVTLFFSISSSAYAESHLPEYLKAELAGKFGEAGCSPYHEVCPKSIFVWEDKVRTRTRLQEDKVQQDLENTIQ